MSVLRLYIFQALYLGCFSSLRSRIYENILDCLITVLGPFFQILLKTGGIESDILMPREIEIPVWNFTQINQEGGQIAYFDHPISAYSSPNTGPKNPELVSKVRS